MRKRILGFQNIAFSEPGYFEFSSFESNGVGVAAISAEAVTNVHQVVGDLLDSIANELINSKTGQLRTDVENPYDAASKLRAALNILRSNLPFVQLLRSDAIISRKAAHGGYLGQLDQHRNLIVRLINAAKQLDSHKNWGDGVPPEVLYAHELLWLYNELATVTRCQGDVIDAAPIFAQCERIRATFGFSNGGEAWAHLRIQSAIVAMEMGRLGQAKSGLIRTYRLLNDQAALKMRALGYIALIEHLAGELQLAAINYRKVLDFCRETGRVRPLSLFASHAANLARADDDPTLARSLFNEAISAASSNPDLMHQARLGLCKLDLLSNGRASREMRATIEHSLRYAAVQGMPRLEAEALLAQAHFHLTQGDIGGAAHSAFQALGICSRRGLYLRGVSAMVLIGKIIHLRGDRDSARIVLTKARGRAQSMLYARKAAEALEEIERIGATNIGAWNRPGPSVQ